MKKQVGFPLLVLISSGFMTGCGNDTISNAYSTIEECASAGNDKIECGVNEAIARKKVTSEAPMYKTEEDCSSDFDQCLPYNNNGSILYHPAMSGFLFTRGLDNQKENKVARPLFLARQDKQSSYSTGSVSPVSMPYYYSSFSTGDNAKISQGKSEVSFGSIGVPKSPFNPTARVIGKGGFSSYGHAAGG